MFPCGDKEQSTDTKISTYASNAATEAIESVAVRESLNGTSLGVADGTEENLNHAHRIRYGSNNYAQSAVRQWLNSDAQMSLDRLGLDLSSATKFITSLSKIFNGAWAEYRQALRDLPTQTGFPFNVEFPKPPDSEDDSENELT